MFPTMTGWMMLEIATAKREEDIARADDSRRTALAMPGVPPRNSRPRLPWWWGLARRPHRSALSG